MKTLSTLVVLVVIGAIALVLVGCSKDNSADSAATAEELFTEGLTYLEDSIGDANMEGSPPGSGTSIRRRRTATSKTHWTSTPTTAGRS